MIFSGEMWEIVQYCALSHKRAPDPSVVQLEDSRCYGFTVTALPVGDYYGFAVHGGANRRFLLADFTITHNVHRQQAAARAASRSKQLLTHPARR